MKQWIILDNAIINLSEVRSVDKTSFAQITVTYKDRSKSIILFESIDERDAKFEEIGLSLVKLKDGEHYE